MVAGEWLVLVAYADGECERFTVGGDTMAEALASASERLADSNRSTGVAGIRIDELNNPYFI